MSIRLVPSPWGLIDAIVGAGPEGDTMMVLDRSWLVHLPKVGWWLACKANLAYLIYRLYKPDTSASGDCNSPAWQRTCSALLVVRS